MQKINFIFNENGDVRIKQSASLKEKASSYDETVHVLPTTYALRKDFQTLSKLYDSAFSTDNAVYAHEFEKLKAHLVEIHGGAVYVNNELEKGAK